MRSLAILAVILTAACSSPETGSPAGGAAPGAATPEQLETSCSVRCAATKRCDPSIDEASCVNTCKTRSAAPGPKIRSDYLAAVSECLKTAPCDKIDDCGDTAAAAISPTATAEAFCDELIKKNAECKAGVTDAAICMRQYKVLADVSIEAARACMTKSCMEYESCVRSNLGG